MKKKLSALLAGILAAPILFSGILLNQPADNSVAAKPARDVRGTFMAGEFIQCASVAPSAAKPLIDNSGMSGLDSYIHLHNTDAANSYKTGLSGNDGAITFAFPEIESLGYMYIWNYNAAGQLNNGMKDIKVEYSTDNINWSNLGDGSFRLSSAIESENNNYGGNASNNQDDVSRTPINFEGIPVKYVRITPNSNYGGSEYGLSEVRFFKFKTRPNTGSLIAASARAPKSSSNAINLANNYGLSDFTTEQATHTNQKDTMWLSDSSLNDSFVVINLDGTYPVDKMYIWNYNAADMLGSGMKQVKIEYTTKQPYKISGGNINYSDGEWTELGTYEIPIGTGESDMPFSLSVDFGNVQAQHIRISPIDNHGGSGFGLSAVRVFAGNGWAVEPSRDWSQLFSSEGSFDYQKSGEYPRNGVGWLQADGIYTLNTNGADRSGSADSSTKSVFLFSDTLIGNFNNFSGTQGQYGKTVSRRGFQNHTFATLVGNKPDPRNIQFYLNTYQNTNSIMGNGNWAQELLRIGDKMYAWAMPFDSNWSALKYILNEFDFNADDFPSFKTSPKQEDMNILVKFNEDGRDYRIEFGGALMDNTESGGATPNPDGYIYIYGLKSFFDGFIHQKSPIVARVTPEGFTDTANWRYYDGTDWVTDATKCAILDGGDGLVSNEFSVSYMETGTFAGKYVMSFTNFTQSPMLAVATSDTPYGPFNHKTDKLSIYNCPESVSILEINGDTGIYTYNAKAHPHLSAAGELLISYNVNSFDFDAALSFEFLHPQFVTLFDVVDYVETIDFTELQDTVLNAEEILNTASSVNIPEKALLQSTLTAAKAVLENQSSSQDSIDKAVEDLLIAINNYNIALSEASSATESSTPESSATESNATESKATESKATESNATESKATESKATESNATESKATESKATESKATESKATESNASSGKADNPKTGENSLIYAALAGIALSVAGFGGYFILRNRKAKYIQ